MSPSDHDIEVLYEYCVSKNINIHPSIRPRRVPGCGLGVYSTDRISSDEQLVRIPVSEIFTTESIPEHFLGRPAREGIAVHAQLAAFFAFGQETDLESYHAWIATWPEFADFFETMPIFWGNLLTNLLRGCLDGHCGTESKTAQLSPATKKQKTSTSLHGSVSRDSNRKAHAVDMGQSDWAANFPSLKILQDQVRLMAEKLALHLHSIHVILPELQILEDPEKLNKFFHSWCLVNTRCFYYVPSLPSDSKHKSSKAKAPADPNEAMGLCPFMDLFNHTAPVSSVTLSGVGSGTVHTPCKVSSGVKGFTTTTTSEISVDKEILFSYGPHTNDTLWSEYGFLLPDSSNSSDSVLLDGIVLQQITEEQRRMLEAHDYLASYTLFNDGSVCYRTEIVAWLPILGTQRWTKCVEEGLDPVDLVDVDESTADQDQQQRRNGTQPNPALSPVHQHYQILEGWLTALHEQVQGDITLLQSMEEADILELFTTLSITRAAIHEGSAEGQLSLARRRQKMCMERCEQISAMAARGVEASISGSSDSDTMA